MPPCAGLAQAQGQKVAGADTGLQSGRADLRVSATSDREQTRGGWSGSPSADRPHSKGRTASSASNRAGRFMVRATSGTLLSL
jgi:hypothetical protein